MDITGTAVAAQDLVVGMVIDSEWVVTRISPRGNRGTVHVTKGSTKRALPVTATTAFNVTTMA